MTCFAYGQTGSGKTFTMEGVQEHAVGDLFQGADIMLEDTGRRFGFTISYFEIYGGKLYDLLNNHATLAAQEDKSGRIVVAGIHEATPQSARDMLQLIQFGSSVRQTHATASNDTSSRSHAICTIKIFEERPDGSRAPGGKLLLVDLAGSERAQDTQSNNKNRRQEGAEINQSLLALKECIRAMEQKGEHIPFRQTKLTMVLRDSFICAKDMCRIIMIACVSPGRSSADHTLNTLRYAERLKERPGSKQVVQKFMRKRSPVRSQDVEMATDENEPDQAALDVEEDKHEDFDEHMAEDI